MMGLAAITSLPSCSAYYDWSRDQHMKDLTNDGAAQLAHAKSSREIAVTEAKAKLESAEMLAAADTVRAHGVARSNQIIGASLKENPNAVIYIPTEAKPVKPIEPDPKDFRGVTTINSPFVIEYKISKANPEV